MPWRRLPQLRILHPIHKYLPTLPQPSAEYQECVARGGGKKGGGVGDVMEGGVGGGTGAAIGAAIAGAVASMLDRARSPTAWKAFPYSDRHYYERKWGGGLGKVCGSGEFPTPFNDPRNTLDVWRYDREMREATVKGTALEGVLDVFWLGMGKAGGGGLGGGGVGGGGGVAHQAPVGNTADAGDGSSGGGGGGGDGGGGSPPLFPEVGGKRGEGTLPGSAGGGGGGDTAPVVRGDSGDTEAAAALALGRKPQSPNSKLGAMIKGNPRNPSDPLGDD
jgi:hypothetical protein